MRVITTPSLLQVTVVAGPLVEVQVRVLDWSSNVKLITVGEPAYGYTSKSDVQQNVTATSYIGTELKRRYRFIYLIAHTSFSGFECTYIKGRATWKIKNIYISYL